jgi:hypothetical protein
MAQTTANQGAAGSTAWPVEIDGVAAVFMAALTAKAAAKTTAGGIHSYHIQNPNIVDAWVQFFDAALASVTVGTTTPVMSLWVPAGGALDASLSAFIAFTTAITIAATTTPTGATAPAVGLVTNLGVR